MTRVAILGGGPAGVGAAWGLRQRDLAEVVLIEREDAVGGNAKSFRWNGHLLDHGSHRLHPATSADVLNDIRSFLGDELLLRPRHGRIRLLGKWVHFPLKPLDLLLNVKPSFALGSLRDALTKSVRRRTAGERQASFASVLQSNLGPTICQHFYFPYARKIWGIDPEALSPIQARRRVSAGSFGKLLRKVLGQIPGLRAPLAGRFFYPAQGFGQISDAYAQRARGKGAELWLGWNIESVTRGAQRTGWQITARRGEETRTMEADYVWSTVPITALLRMLRPEPPPEVMARIEEIDYRAMLLVYLELEVERFSEYDAHYFPGADVAITRLSEPKNYAARRKPARRTVLCAELPCDAGEGYWTMGDDELAQVVEDDLVRAGIRLPVRPVAVVTRRLAQAYPIYRRGYLEAFSVMDGWLREVPHLLSYGRQGLFAHDNTHHALAMAYAACECLGANGFDDQLWAAYRKEFESHVVED